MRPISEQLVQHLGTYVSPLNANALWKRAREQSGVFGEPTTDVERARLSSALEHGLGFFVSDPTRRARAISELRATLAGEPAPSVTSERFEVRTENDLSAVRTAGRRLAETIGANGFTAQKVTTIISELARNIVSYTAGGEIHLASAHSPKRMVSIAASDEGSGIPNLDEILRGTYRSRTGLGRGILGCKRLADRFEIDTSTRGTRIEVEVFV